MAVAAPPGEMVERGEVVNEIDALPDVEWASLADLFDELESDWDEYPVWSGELYLEKHRGTLTSQAKTKRNNRKGEIALAEAELWSSIALARTGESYPHEDLEEAWKILLFNQFHDILPGSSVTDVYADADRGVRIGVRRRVVGPLSGAGRVGRPAGPGGPGLSHQSALLAVAPDTGDRCRGRGRQRD